MAMAFRYVVTNFVAIAAAAMVTVSRTQAKAQLSALLDKVAAGEEVIITRRGRAVAPIRSALRPKHSLRWDDLAAFRATMPSLSRPSTELLREARDEGM
ncbi:MAG: type II toxin-antitoxin system prevent-host-death family antitoxin [Azospirillaceae bacterium]|nr:type II toxin-antitoxin system prevent-host-death family antitoxin [Azospirillaceae bacterium]